jgi:hypothetical protein
MAMNLKISVFSTKSNRHLQEMLTIRIVEGWVPFFVEAFQFAAGKGNVCWMKPMLKKALGWIPPAVVRDCGCEYPGKKRRVKCGLRAWFLREDHCFKKYPSASRPLERNRTYPDGYKS